MSLDTHRLASGDDHGYLQDTLNNTSRQLDILCGILTTIASAQSHYSNRMEHLPAIMGKSASTRRGLRKLQSGKFWPQRWSWRFQVVRVLVWAICKAHICRALHQVSYYMYYTCLDTFPKVGVVSREVTPLGLYAPLRAQVVMQCSESELGPYGTMRVRGHGGGSGSAPRIVCMT